MRRSLFSMMSEVPPPPRRPQGGPRRPSPEETGSNNKFYVMMVGCVALFPVGIGLLKAFEKKFLWKPAPAEIENVAEDSITYRYVAYDQLFRHTQKREKLRNEKYAKGDRVFVHVHTRNELLSVLDPPNFVYFWRDLKENPYKGKRIEF